MKYLSSRLSKWMPNKQPVQVDSHPRLSGIMDTVNSTLAHGPETRLPSEFYDQKLIDIINRISVEEWFAGFDQNNEYRTLGIGPLAGDIVARMLGKIEASGNDVLLEVGGRDGPGEGRGEEKSLMLALSGCHDTTLAALLTSLGSFAGERWPPYTSHVAIELFKDTARADGEGPINKPLNRPATATSAGHQNESQTGTTLMSWLGLSRSKQLATESIARKRLSDLTSSETQKLNGYFVRLRYNDRPMTIPGCKPLGRHWKGDDSFCTLEAFKGIVDSFTPMDWKDECLRNLDSPATKEGERPAGVEKGEKRL